MELPQEADDYIRESIDDSVGLLHKLRAAEASNVHLRRQYLSVQSKLKEKDVAVERSRAEASMNAVALKKFVEENQKLATECFKLLSSCSKWEDECSLYDRDREALMDFANEADERAKEAEIMNHDLEEERKKLVDELNSYKFLSQSQLVDVSKDDLHVEQILLDSLLTTVLAKDEITSIARNFLEAHCGVEVCEQLLNMWTGLKPLTQKVVALIAQVKHFEKDKDHLTMNLRRAEDEVNVLFEENNILNEENKRLMRQCHRKKSDSGSGGSSVSGKGKRKSSPKMSSSPAEKKIISGDINTLRQPLSLLQYNSPEKRMHK